MTPHPATAFSLSVKSRTTMALVLVGLLVIGVTSYFHLNLESQRRAELINGELKSVPLLYAEPLSRSVAAQQPLVTERLLNSIMSHDGIHAVELSTVQGQRLRLGGALEDKEPVQTTFELRHPVEASPLGLVRVYAEPATWRSTLAQDHVLRLILNLFLLVLVLSALAAWMLDRVLLRHLRRFSSQAVAFDASSGAESLQWLDSGPHSHPPRELQELNHAIEHVQHSLSEQLRLEQQRVKALDETVAKQTQALRAAEQALEQKQRELATMSRVDPLTGLSNRRDFDDALRREFKRAQRQHGWLSIAVLDLDHFKAYNERYGHAAGDEVLKRFARLLAERFKRDTDIVARLGGEEFVALLPGFDTASAQSLLDQLREDFRAMHVEHLGSPVARVVTVSIGLAAYCPAHPFLSPQALLQAADEALYIAKHAGRDRVSLAA